MKHVLVVPRPLAALATFHAVLLPALPVLLLVQAHGGRGSETLSAGGPAQPATSALFDALMKPPSVPWPLAVFLAVHVLVFFALPAVLIFAFAGRRGTARRLDRDELGALSTGPILSPGEQRVAATSIGPAVGAGADVSTNTEKLREDARRGDWHAFWLPLHVVTQMMTSFVILPGVLAVLGTTPVRPLWQVLLVQLGTASLVTYFIRWLWAAVGASLCTPVDVLERRARS
jgi:hypothetical protein